MSSRRRPSFFLPGTPWERWLKQAFCLCTWEAVSPYFFARYNRYLYEVDIYYNDVSKQTILNTVITHTHKVLPANSVVIFGHVCAVFTSLVGYDMTMDRRSR
jgi:hypothetical protein